LLIQGTDRLEPYVMMIRAVYTRRSGYGSR
jgi:hypothetical protein